MIQCRSKETASEWEQGELQAEEHESRGTVARLTLAGPVGLVSASCQLLRPETHVTSCRRHNLGTQPFQGFGILPRHDDRVATK